MAKILLVEDDPELVSSVKDWLIHHENHTVDSVGDGQDALHLLSCSTYDVIILDWHLGESITGVDVCKRFRATNGTTPIIMLTGKTSIEDKEIGFDCGADDYVTKPVELRELSIRVRALMRRPVPLQSNTLTIGNLILNLDNHEVRRGGEVISLSSKEVALLEFLARHPGHYFSAETLLERVWSAESDTTWLTVRVWIKRLRDKLDAPGEPSLIENIRGLGYRIRHL